MGAHHQEGFQACQSSSRRLDLLGGRALLHPFRSVRRRSRGTISPRRDLVKKPQQFTVATEKKTCSLAPSDSTSIASGVPGADEPSLLSSGVPAAFGWKFGFLSTMEKALFRPPRVTPLLVPPLPLPLPRPRGPREPLPLPRPLPRVTTGPSLSPSSVAFPAPSSSSSASVAGSSSSTCCCSGAESSGSESSIIAFWTGCG